MAFSAGTKLGRYQVAAPVGAGGMGEVYRAHDDRLGRDVAVKVLPQSLTRDEDRLRRFTAEARAVAALNHPNILAIYDVGTQDGLPFIVTELLKGETLRERMRPGALPTRRALEFARQIASGLAAAHEAGIVHRDLKPENIFITADGQVKLLDFGVAKLMPLADDLTKSKQTAAGAVVGTVGYMSPEQVRGKIVDHRSDIFSLGVVLHEMLSGTRTFQGESGIEVMNAILKDEPPELTVAGSGVAAVVEHCLQKDPGHRFQSARDLSFALAALSSPSQTQAGAAPAPQRSHMPLLMAVMVLALAAAAALAWWYRVAHATQPASKTVAFQRLTDFVGLETAPAISPDNKAVAFVADAGGARQIWIHLTAGGTPLQLTHNAGDHLNPRWSQDSASIVYYVPGQVGDTQGALWEIAALGGVPRRIASALTEADVSHDGKRLAFFRLENEQAELVVSDRNGANVQVVARFKDYTFAHPRWAPDDGSIAYEHADAIWSDDIFVIPAAGGDPRRITQEDDLIEGLAWTPDGSAMVYASSRGSTVLYLPLLHLWLQRLDGRPAQQLSFGDASYQDPDVGRDGRIVLSRWRMQFDIWKFPADGDPAANGTHGVRLTQQTGQVQTPTVAPDESQMAFLSDSGGHGNIWVKDLKTGDLRQVTHETDPKIVLGVPIWSPDGSAIVFAESRGAGAFSAVDYWSVRPDGSDLRNVISEGAWASWSSDGRWLYYSADIPTKGGAPYDIYKIPVNGGSSQRVRSEGGISPIPSPDGSTLYYVVSLPAMRGLRDYEIRRARPEGAESSLLLRIDGERVPIWQGLHGEISHNGKWLAFPLNDEYGTNLWLLSTSDGKLHRAVDFGQRRTFIARRVAWSHDDRFIYAAVGEGDADIVSLDGLLP